jgi:hypothetical protein
MKLKLISVISILLMIIHAGWAQSVKMQVCNKDGTVHVYHLDEIRKLTFAGTTGIHDLQISAVIKNFNLLKSYPNPFNNSTTISYKLPGDGMTEIAIVDLNGKVIKTFPGGNQSSGDHSLTWDGTTSTGEKAPTGIYICRFIFNDQLQSTKILLIK